MNTFISMHWYLQSTCAREVTKGIFFNELIFIQQLSSAIYDSGSRAILHNLSEEGAVLSSSRFPK
jgi:hypothetical protein